MSEPDLRPENQNVHPRLKQAAFYAAQIRYLHRKKNPDTCHESYQLVDNCECVLCCAELLYRRVERLTLALMHLCEGPSAVRDIAEQALEER